jgi:hypothetical protein
MIVSNNSMSHVRGALPVTVSPVRLSRAPDVLGSFPDTVSSVCLSCPRCPGSSSRHGQSYPSLSCPRCPGFPSRYGQSSPSLSCPRCPGFPSQRGQSCPSLSSPRCGSELPLASARYDVTVKGNMTQHVTWRSGDSNRLYGGCRKLTGVEGGSLVPT